MTSARPGPARQRFESRFGVRRGHPIRVVWDGPGGSTVTTGLYARVSSTGWLHLSISDGHPIIQVSRITEAEEVD
jgi:hypothetical protein